MIGTNNKLWNIASTERYVLHIQVLPMNGTLAMGMFCFCKVSFLSGLHNEFLYVDKLLRPSNINTKHINHTNVQTSVSYLSPSKFAFFNRCIRNKNTSAASIF